MNADITERLAKGLYAQKKRKGKAPGEGSKWVKIDAFDPIAPTVANVTPKVRLGKEVILTIYANIVEGKSLPPEPANLPTRDCTPDPSIDEGKERRKKKAAIGKKARKAHHNEPGHHMLAHLKRANHLEAEMLNVREGLQAEINHLQMMATEAERLAGEKVVENESLHSALQKEEFVLTKLKEALALEEKRKQKVEGRVAGLEAQMPKSISEVAAWAMEEFRVFPKMKDLNIAFG
ncbi:hypothetical protein COCNU_08G000550 [Cocos nucifera]|uniref:Uncharacterized protein n=1 Tax=Cocos nucifera TaxID=13894 RepID=A0A8K0IGM8_COCNU|nr:hypothetical protein COCNU_08G000550 [Cocos nucifera]